MSWQRVKIKSPLTDDIFVATFVTDDDGETVQVHKSGSDELGERLDELTATGTESDTSTAAETGAVQTPEGIKSVSQVAPPHERVKSEKDKVRVDGAQTADTSSGRSSSSKSGSKGK